MRKAVYVDDDVEISFTPTVTGELRISIDNGEQFMMLHLKRADVDRLRSDLYDMEKDLKGDE